MGLKDMFNCLTKPKAIVRDPVWSPSPKLKRTDDSYWKALQQFVDRRQPSSEFRDSVASEILDIGCVAGTEDRCIKLISAKWRGTMVSLRRHPDLTYQTAIIVDLEILTKLRHPNLLLLMATTHTDKYGHISVFESVTCTLYSVIHQQNKRMSMQDIARIGLNLADALQYCHMRGYIHGAVNPHCVYFVPNGTAKLGGWKLATIQSAPYNRCSTERNYEKCLRSEMFEWQAPELIYRHRLSTKSDVFGLSLLLWEMGTARKPWDGFTRLYVELQYILRANSFIEDFLDFPPCLRKVLADGLLIDVTKRTSSIDEIQKTLQKLIVSEEGRVTPVDQSSEQQESENAHDSEEVRTSISIIEPDYKNTIPLKESSVEKVVDMSDDSLTNQSFLSAVKQFSHDSILNINVEEDVLLTRSSSDSNERPAAAVQTTEHGACLSYSSREPKNDEELRDVTGSETKRLRKKRSLSKKKQICKKHTPSIAFSASLSSIASTSSSSSTNSTNVKKYTHYVPCKPVIHCLKHAPSIASSASSSLISSTSSTSAKKAANYVPWKPASHFTCMQVLSIASPASSSSSSSTSSTRAKKHTDHVPNEPASHRKKQIPSIASSASTISISPSSSTGSKKNVDYVQCKPASHSTSMQVNFTNSPGEYEGLQWVPDFDAIREKLRAKRRVNIEDAVAQLKVSSSDSDSTEDSSWRREREICFSRMCHEAHYPYNGSQRSWTLLSRPRIDINSNIDNSEGPYPTTGTLQDAITVILENAFEDGEDTDAENIEELLSTSS